MKLIKNIIRMIFRKSQEHLKQLEYFDNPPENLSMSNISIDMRNPVTGKKYISIGKDSSVNATFTFETETGFIRILIEFLLVIVSLFVVRLYR